MVGAIFQDSAKSLRLWLYAFYLMASTRCGISAKQLERELGVTYKTAWRMLNKICSLMTTDESVPLQGTVEADMGGKARFMHADKRADSCARNRRRLRFGFGQVSTNLLGRIRLSRQQPGRGRVGNLQRIAGSD
jgi:hypothetical protein